MCNEHFTTAHGHLTNQAFKRDEWNQLLKLQGRSNDVDIDDDLALDYYDDFVSASTPPPSDALSSPVPEGGDADSDDTSSTGSESSE